MDESLETVGLSFEGDLTGSGVAAIVSSLEMYSAMVELHPDAAVGAGDVLRVSVLPDAPDAARAAIESAVGRVEIAQVHRVYRMGSRNESMLTNYISMVVPAGAEAEVMLMLLDDGNEILYQSNYGDLGTVGFRVHVPFSVQMSSGETVLERANRYHGLGFVGHAAPVFAPLYQTQHSVESEADELFFDYGFPDSPDPSDPAQDAHIRYHYRKMQMLAAWEDVYGVDGFVDGADADSIPEYLEVERKVVAVIDNGMFLRYGDFSGANGYSGAVTTLPSPTLDNEYTFTRGSNTSVFPANLYGHPELIDRGTSPGPGVQWFNELEVNGIAGDDDDSNGYIDDYFGIDLVGSDVHDFTDFDTIPFPDPVENPVLENTGIRHHGTMAGILIAGIPNNDGTLDEELPDVEKLSNNSITPANGTSGGMIGICPSCEIMPVRTHLQSYNNGSIANDTSDVFYAGRSELAILYAAGYKSGVGGAAGTYSGTRADVLGIMIAIESYDPMFHEAIKIARLAGCVLIGSSGNNGVSMDVNPYFPNVWPEVLAVGASEFRELKDDVNRLDLGQLERRQVSANSAFSDNAGNGSNYGWALDVVAYSASPEDSRRSKKITDPSTIVPSTHTASQKSTPYATTAGLNLKDDKFNYGPGVGTSSAMPQVAAVAGLVLTKYPELNPMEVQAVLQVSADDLKYETSGWRRWDPSRELFYKVVEFPEDARAGRDMYTGWGRIDAMNALSKAKEVVDGKKSNFTHFDFTYTGMASGRHRKNDVTGNWEHRILSMIRDDHEDEYPTGSAISTDHVVFDGWIVEGASGTQLTSTELGEVLFGSPVVARLDLDAQTLYLKRDLVQGGTFSVPSDAMFTMGIDDVDGYISKEGDLVTREQVFSISTMDRVPDYYHRVSNVTDLNLAIASAKAETGGQVHIIELAPGVDGVAGTPYVLTGAIDFGGKDFVIRSEDPGDMDVVKNTVLRRTGPGRIITFDGTETNKSGVLGITIEGDGLTNGGIEGSFVVNYSTGEEIEGAKATISFCRFVNNYASGDGGAINGIWGNIFQNVFGDLSNEGTSGRNYATGNGGAIANQHQGKLYQNIFWYNEAGGEGGAIYGSHSEIVSNFILNNTAGTHGGGIAYASTEYWFTSWWSHPEYSRATIHSNIIYGNHASGGKGGGVYDAHGSIMKNTIYLNQALIPAYGLADCARINRTSKFNQSVTWSPILQSRDNIVWDNRDLDELGISQVDNGDQLTIFEDCPVDLDTGIPLIDPGTGKQYECNCLDNSAISELNNPVSPAGDGTGNIGPFSSPSLLTVSDLKFQARDEPANPLFPDLEWGKFLHLSYNVNDVNDPDNSPLVDMGHKGGDVDPSPVEDGDPLTPPLPNYSERYFRDIDDQVGPLGVLRTRPHPNYPENETSIMAFVRDIGADEVPTPNNGDSESSIQWWERVK